MIGFWRRLGRNRGAVLGLAVLSGIVVVAALAPVLYPTSPWRIVNRPFLAPFSVAGLPLGTDALGRDILAGLVHGSRVSLLIGVASTLAAMLVGVPVGAAAGYLGGWIGEAAMRVTEFFQVIPAFVLAIVVVSILQPSVGSIVVAIAVVSWPPVARTVRGEVLTVRSREYVQAAIVAGQPVRTVIISEVLPNVISPIIVLGSLMTATAILLESSLSFLGLGDPNVMSWGYMVGAGRTRVLDQWWISFIPGAAIFTTVMALNLCGDGLNDALNPTLKNGRP